MVSESNIAQNPIAINMPFLAGVKIDALHDFVDVAQELSKRFVYANINNIGLIIFLLITLFIFLFPLFNKFKKILILKIKKNQIFLSSVMFIIFLILSVIIDVAPFYPKANWLSALEEIFEMYSSMALYTTTISIKKYNSTNEKKE